jgi:Na+/H+-dicarboxylate symporter
LIVGVDRLLDMLRTAVDVVGDDAAVSCAMARTEGGLDKEVFLGDDGNTPARRTPAA